MGPLDLRTTDGTMIPVTTYRALDRIANGLGMVEVGEIVPATFIGTLGEENRTDFDRLLELGVVELVSAPRGAAKGADAPADAPAKADGARTEPARPAAASPRPKRSRKTKTSKPAKPAAAPKS